MRTADRQKIRHGSGGKRYRRISSGCDVIRCLRGKFRPGWITAYNITQKYTHLHIDLVNGVSTNCVSIQTAREMAMSVAKSFSANWGVSITGYASPVPGHHMTELSACYTIVFDEHHLASGNITAE